MENLFKGLLILTVLIYKTSSEEEENISKAYNNSKLFSSNLVELFFKEYKKNFGKNLEFDEEFNVSL